MKFPVAITALLCLPLCAQEDTAGSLADRAGELADRAELVDARSEPVEPSVVELGEGRYRVGELVEIDSRSRTVSVPAEIHFDGRTRQDGLAAETETEGEVLIEYLLAMRETGPTHEALCLTDARATELRIALALLGYEPDPGVLAAQAVDARGNPRPDVDPLARASRPASQPVVAPDARLQVAIRWQGETGEVEHPAMACLVRRASDRPGDLELFALTGSFVREFGHGERRRTFFAAESEGTLISTFLVDTAILNPGDEEALDDELWVPRAELLPERGTRVTIVLSPADDPPDPPR